MLRDSSRALLFSVAAAALAALPGAAEAQYGTAYLTRRLGELHAQYAVGMNAWGPTQTGSLRRGARRSFDFVLPSGACYKFIAVGDGDVVDLDLHVRRGNQEVARDTATDNFPVASHCTTDEARVGVEIHVVNGRGEFAFAVYQGPAGSLPLTQVSNPVQAPAPRAPGVVPAPQVPAPAPAQPQRPTDPLGQRLYELSQTFAPGSVLFGQWHRGALSRGDEQDFFWNLQPGHCYTVIAVGSPSATDLDIYLFDPNRRRVTSDRERNNFPHLTHCSSLPGPYRVHVKMYRGEGPYAVGVFDQTAGAAPAQAPIPRPLPVAPAPAPAPAADPLAQRLAELAPTFAPGQAAVSPVLRGALDTHGRQDFPVNLQAGHCYTVIAVGAPSASDLDLYLFDPNNSRKTSDRERNNMPHITHCAGLPGPYRVRVQMYRGSGPFVMQVFGQ